MSIADSGCSRQLRARLHLFTVFVRLFDSLAQPPISTGTLRLLDHIEIGVDGQTFSTVLVDGLPIED